MSSAPTPHLRIESGDVAIRDVRAERWQYRIRLLGTWLAGAGLIALERNVGTVCFASPAMLFFTALLLGRHHGAPIAGVRIQGKPGVIRIDEEGIELEIEGVRRRFARSELAAGWTERFREGDDDVVLQVRTGAILRWRAANEGESRAALRAAGVAPEQRAVTLRLGVAEDSGTRVVIVFLSLIVGLLTLVTLGSLSLVVLRAARDEPFVTAFFGGLPLVLGYVALHILLRPLVTATVRIGTDGVSVERLVRTRFVPRAAIAEVSASGNDIEIQVRGGKDIKLPVSSADEAATVAQRIAEALADRGDAAAEAVQTQLDRRGRAIDAWLREVRALARGTGGYRDALLDRDELAAVVEDGAASAERRIAAAAALACDEAGKKRVRIAAEACVDERLRAAIEETAEEEITASRIDEALRASEKRG